MKLEQNSNMFWQGMLFQKQIQCMAIGNSKALVKE